MTGYSPLQVKVWGDFACFTRPEMKVERVTYPVMTPSAARGVLEAIFWKPQFRWIIREIHVLNDIAYFSILRNEVNSRASEAMGRKRIRSDAAFFAEDDRAQRNALALRNVSYVITADVDVKDDVQEDAAKYRDQFQRRVRRGQCFHQPYLGCREFTAYFGLPTETDTPIDRSEPLGRMLFDMDYERDGNGRGQPRFFDARLERGVMRVPPDMYREVS